MDVKHDVANASGANDRPGDSGGQDRPGRRIAVVVLQLGGPDSLDAVKPYLDNFFTDPAILTVPQPIRYLLRKFIVTRRTPITREIYAQLGGKSPILEQTNAQSEALEGALADFGTVKTFVCMRYWHPLARDVAREVQDWNPDQIVLLPLYPQYSTTTTGSAIYDWQDAATAIGLDKPTRAICCYPLHRRWIDAKVDLIRQHWPENPDNIPLRVLFTAHGLPTSIVKKGDPYAWQVERTAEMLAKRLDIPGLDWKLCFQSRVTPQEWLKPDTEDEVKEAGKAGVGIIMVPIAFVSEHSETLVELDIEYEEIAEEYKVPLYARIPTVQDHPAYIDCLSDLVRDAVLAAEEDRAPSPPHCPSDRSRCACRELRSEQGAPRRGQTPWSVRGPGRAPSAASSPATAEAGSTD